MKRSDNLAWSQVKVGIFIVAALLFFSGGILVMGDKTKFFVPKGKLSVIMNDVAGLKIGAPVWLAGVDVGIVREIHFERPNQTNEVEVVMKIERESLKKIGKDSRITVKTRGLLGEKYVDITPSQFVAETPETRLHGMSVTKLDDVMQKAGSAFDRLNKMMDTMDRGEGTLGKFTKDPHLYDNLVKLSAELKVFAENVNRGEGTLGQLTRKREPYDRLMGILDRADQTLKEIQTAEGTMHKLIYDRQLYDKLVLLADKSAQAADDVRELNRKLTSKESTVGKLLGDREFYDKGMQLMERADRSVGALEEITSRVNRGDGTVGKLLNDKELYDRLNRMVDDTNALVKDIKENPKRYVKFSVF
jgi:phospholipid/cholesterol/gamma-HCH transport system substrate-binding protein